MNDQKLKIRIQLAQQNQPASQPPSMNILKPNKKKPNEKNNSSFDWRKILLAFLSIVFISALISYLIIWWHDEGQPVTETEPTIVTQKEITPSINTPLDELAAVELDDNTTELSPLEDEAITDQIASTTAKIATELKPVQKQDEKVTTNSTDDPVEVVPSTDSSLIEHMLEDQPQVVRAQLTSAINQREPIDIIDYVWIDNNTTQQILFFVQLRDLTGKRVSVHWHYEDALVAKVPLKIGSNNWRTYASKLLSKNSLGNWRVTLHDQSGNLLSQRSFIVGSRS